MHIRGLVSKFRSYMPTNARVYDYGFQMLYKHVNYDNTSEQLGKSLKSCLQNYVTYYYHSGNLVLQ
jgi:hypothetical protein